MTQRFHATANEANRVLKIICPQIFSHVKNESQARKLIRKGVITVNDNTVASNFILHVGDEICFHEHQLIVPVFKLPLKVVFEDDYVAVVFKPANLPTSGNFHRTLVNALPHNLSASSQDDALLCPQPCHRLDSATCGLVVCTKTYDAQQHLLHLFKTRKMDKTYLAVVEGACPAQTIDDSIDGKSAITEIAPLKSFLIKGHHYTLINAIPITGRTHQIRKHLAGIQHPILGDALYNEAPTKPTNGLLLCAYQLSFNHPITNETIELSIQPPKKFRRFWVFDE